jgi:hypothetical protein
MMMCPPGNISATGEDMPSAPRAAAKFRDSQEFFWNKTAEEFLGELAK